MTDVLITHGEDEINFHFENPASVRNPNNVPYYVIGKEGEINEVQVEVHHYANFPLPGGGYRVDHYAEVSIPIGEGDIRSAYYIEPGQQRIIETPFGPVEVFHKPEEPKSE